MITITFSRWFVTFLGMMLTLGIIASYINNVNGKLWSNASQNIVLISIIISSALFATIWCWIRKDSNNGRTTD